MMLSWREFSSRELDLARGVSFDACGAKGAAAAARLVRSWLGWLLLRFSLSLDGDRDGDADLDRDLEEDLERDLLLLLLPRELDDDDGRFCLPALPLPLLLPLLPPRLLLSTR